MKHRIQSILTSLTLAASAAAQGHHYVYDDGRADTGLGTGYDADFCWVQSFEAVNGWDTIVSVETAIGTVQHDPPHIPNGTPITLCVWEDPDDDGEFGDAVLVSMRQTTVRGAGEGGVTNYSVPNALVQGRFFVGAMVVVPAGCTAAPLDEHTRAMGRSIVAVSVPPGTFDPVHPYDALWGHIEVLAPFLDCCWVLRAYGADPLPTTYCKPKTDSAGCVPQITWTGAPSASAGSGFTILASNLLDHRRGFFFYGTTGADELPFAGGTLCVAQPLHRTRGTNTSGVAGGPNCTGWMSFDFNEWIASGADPSLGLGTIVNAQFYYRDPGEKAPNDAGLTGGVQFVIGL
ncbi:MAG: hypothetical protein U1F29_12425 [Planctomycetota bacterium]